MRIISDFRDYYDYVQTYSQSSDHKRLYIRKTQELKQNSIEYHQIINFIKKHEIFNIFINMNCSVRILCFCGRIYPQFVFKVYKVPNTHAFGYYDDIICYSISEIDSVVSQYFCDPRNSRKTEKYSFIRKSIVQYIQDIKKIKDFSIFRICSTPIISIDKNYNSYNVFLNPSLKEFKFHSIMDPYAVYQELQMFFSNYLIQEKEIITLSDESEIVKKGFDLKDSFRNTKNRLKK